MARKSDWEQALADYLAAATESPYRYGHHDCLLHPANAILAVTGTDLGKGHRGRYASARAARRYLNSLGFRSPSEMLDSLLEDKPPAFAQRGDIVLISRDNPIFVKRPAWDVPAVCTGGEAVVVGEHGGRTGLIAIPRSEWTKAWKV